MSTPSGKNLSPAERCAIIERIIITHPAFTALQAELDRCHLYAQNISTSNPPCLAILGETGAGKTTLLDDWLTRQKYQRSETSSGSLQPYLYVSVPAKASIKGTAAAFLSTLGDPNSARGTQWNMVNRLYALIKSCQVRMIFVDEFQHLLNRDTQRVLNEVADFLKDLINQTRVPMILVGQPGEAEPILQTNPQLSRRVGSPRYLKSFPWERSEPCTLSEFCTLMESIDQELPLDPSGLGDPNVAFRFHYATDGYLGWIMQLVRYAAYRAIKTGCPTLTRPLLQQGYDACLAGTVVGLGKTNPFAHETFQ
jgi:hypothetical protein